MLVTYDELKKLNWNNLSQSYVDELNNALHKYDITDYREIRLFIANVIEETGRGQYKYQINRPQGKYSGGGAMQLTHSQEYMLYATYQILEEHPDIKGLNYNGINIKYVSPRYPRGYDYTSAYEGILHFAQQKGYNISSYTDIYDKGIEHVGDNFFWDSGAYDFAVSKGLSRIHGEQYFDDTFFQQSTTAQLDFTVDKINKKTPSRPKRHEHYKEIVEAGIIN